MTENFIRAIRLKRALVPDWNTYPFRLNAVKRLDELSFDSPVTFIAGENGAGKSTLLEAIAIGAGMNPEGGSFNMRFESRATHSGLHDYLTIVRGVRRPKDGYFLRAESMYNVASEIDRQEEDMPGMLDSYGGRSLHGQSHGESFMALIQNRFRSDGLYFLDEPEAPLSPMRQMALLVELHRLTERRCQFVIATHSPILMSYPGAKILMLDEEGYQCVPYKQTEHYIFTKLFLENPERMLDRLFDED